MRVSVCAGFCAQWSKHQRGHRLVRGSVHSGANTREATGFTHFAGWLPAPRVPSTRHKSVVRRRSLLCTVAQRPRRPSCWLAASPFVCPAPSTRKSSVRQRCLLCTGTVEQKSARLQTSLLLMDAQPNTQETTVEQRPARLQGSLLLLAGCQSLNCTGTVQQKRERSQISLFLLIGCQSLGRSAPRRQILGEATKSSVHSEPEIREDTGLRHTLLSATVVRSLKHKIIFGDAATSAVHKYSAADAKEATGFIFLTG